MKDVIYLGYFSGVDENSDHYFLGFMNYNYIETLVIFRSNSKTLNKDNDGFLLVKDILKKNEILAYNQALNAAQKYINLL